MVRLTAQLFASRVRKTGRSGPALIGVRAVLSDLKLCNRRVKWRVGPFCVEDSPSVTTPDGSSQDEKASGRSVTGSQRFADITESAQNEKSRGQSATGF